MITPILKEKTVYLLRQLKNYDKTTYDHSIRVAQNSIAVTEKYPELISIDGNVFYTGCLLHDIGKIGISEKILTKPSRYTPEEREDMEQHPLMGAHMLREYPKEVVLCALLHHEKIDGSGYPTHFEDGEIPAYCEFLSVLDVLDALTSARPYKAAITDFSIIEEILSNEPLRKKYVDIVVNLLKQGKLLTEKEIQTCQEKIS
jgi:putative nucleotidyltransferase with HDIG domain